ncbi:MAG: peptidoglycan DD-metalloendopeptidase family protein [Actinomycetota bacterium]|nr:peptidoglycan DD-metalloendopeptidase family protein [Actinomycetota bacterium]
MALRPRARRPFLSVLAAGLAIGFLALPAVGQSLDELQRRKEAAARRAAQAAARGDDLAGIVSALDALRADAEAKVDALEAELDELDVRINEKRALLTAAQKRMAVLTVELQGILEQLSTRTDVFIDRAVAAYKAGPTAYVEGVLSSESFNDLIDRYEYFESVLDTDAELIDEITVLRDEVDARRTEVEEKEQQIYEAKLALQQDRQAIEVIHTQRLAVLEERRAIVAQKESLLSEVRGRQHRWEAVEDQLAQEVAEKTAIINNFGSSSSGPFPTGGGQLLWPAAGPVTSGFGYRTHPIFGDTRFHAGIDIGAPYGAPVISSDAGSVIYAGVMSGYGNVIVVDHGSGLATTYNHLSSFLVSEGQGVARGVQIGTVGCTGYCTGPHLHFEVRVNGSPVDPMPYLQ